MSVCVCVCVYVCAQPKRPAMCAQHKENTKDQEFRGYKERGEGDQKKKKEDEIGLVHIFFSFFFYKQKHDALFKKKKHFFGP